MDSWLIIATIMMLFFLISIWMAAAKWAAKQWYLLSLLTMIGAVITYGVLQSPRPEPKPENAMFKSMTAEDLMAQLQVQLKENPNDAGLWFQLGQGYLLNKELDAALICFDYAIQLTELPSSTQLAAKATALYYLGSQQMSGEVSLLLEQALQLEPYNEAALSLLANDHFISFRFQQAIDTWTYLLDSNDPKLDRESVIRSIHQAKALMQTSTR
ncbi:TPR domain-containing protein [Vibrio vulnificus]|uniref:TPR domain-containing protein n=1 Tax=Vibrio vulnificus TaxID=672 RepID=UPI0019D46208|nr:hypothetical protein [Vibrio vulnificus]EJT0552752.1 hypothetical protein [Vibrio vulnificus]MBN8083926.1 hypothetical protein [Vibrio vulnificus]MBN8126832.1 hypothetical protein [Vibrio vulnificus]MBN8131223.1 hypothetical protein [Vibrio vulnificus]MBN8135431.1 hypothetical protein [Vibrio vulnificus]